MLLLGNDAIINPSFTKSSVFLQIRTVMRPLEYVVECAPPLEPRRLVRQTFRVLLRSCNAPFDTGIKAPLKYINGTDVAINRCCGVYPPIVDVRQNLKASLLLASHGCLRAKN